MNFNSITMLVKTHLRSVSTQVTRSHARGFTRISFVPRQFGSFSTISAHRFSSANSRIIFYTRSKSLLKSCTAAAKQYRKLSTLQGSNLFNKNNNDVKRQTLEYLLFQKSANFHTTDPKKAVPPILILILRPFLKGFAMLFGRFLKRWWSNLTPAEKKEIIMNFSKKWAKYFGFSGVVGFGLGSVFYATHLEIDPLTNRKRFIMFSENQIEQLAQLELNQLVEGYKGEILPTTHPAYKRVVKVAYRLILANMDIREVHKHDWQVTVVESDEVNAFVLPNGSIFIFSGMLKVCLNDDQLGIVLGHEMSHCLLKHVSELLSQSHIMDLLLLIPIVFIWALLPSTLAALAHGFAEYWQSLRFQLPYNRKLELEADNVGLMLAAKACFDVREASAFWAQMQQRDFHGLSIAPNIEEWMSTHPSHENRRAILDANMDEAIRMRDKHQCPALPPRDPRWRLKTAVPISR